MSRDVSHHGDMILTSDGRIVLVVKGSLVSLKAMGPCGPSLWLVVMIVVSARHKSVCESISMPICVSLSKATVELTLLIIYSSRPRPSQVSAELLGLRL